MSTVAASGALQPQMPYMQFDSQDFGRPAEALQCWRDSLSRNCEMDLADGEEASCFSAKVEMWKMDQVLIGGGQFGPLQTRRRSQRNIRADQLDCYRLLLLHRGHFDCDADGRRVRLQPGRFVITDMSRPESSISSSGTTVAYIPRDQLDEALPRPLDLHGAAPDNACSRLLAAHLLAIHGRIGEAAPEELPGLARATVSLVAASLALDAANAEGARPIVEGSLLRKGRRYVDEHLADEGLGAVQLCQHLRISRSSLYRVFEPVGGVSQFVKERRLARVHEILSRPGGRPQIGRVAEEHGFRNAASFSKAFREQYGYSAREAVQQACAGTGAGRGEHEVQGLFAPLMH